MGLSPFPIILVNESLSLNIGAWTPPTWEGGKGRRLSPNVMPFFPGVFLCLFFSSEVSASSLWHPFQGRQGGRMGRQRSLHGFQHIHNKIESKNKLKKTGQLEGGFLTVI